MDIFFLVCGGDDMRDINRIEPIINDLKKLWLLNPDMRLCQLLYWVASKSGWNNDDLFYLEDDIVSNQLKKELYP